MLLCGLVPQTWWRKYCQSKHLSGQQTDGSESDGSNHRNYWPAPYLNLQTQGGGGDHLTSGDLAWEISIVCSYFISTLSLWSLCSDCSLQPRSEQRSHHMRGGSYCNQCNPQSLSQAKLNDSIHEDHPSSASGFSKCEDHHQHPLKPSCSWDANWRSPLKSCTFAVRFRLRGALTDELRV